MAENDLKDLDAVSKSSLSAGECCTMRTADVDPTVEAKVMERPYGRALSMAGVFAGVGFLIGLPASVIAVPFFDLTGLVGPGGDSSSVPFHFGAAVVLGMVCGVAGWMTGFSTGTTLEKIEDRRILRERQRQPEAGQLDYAADEGVGALSDTARQQNTTEI